MKVKRGHPDVQSDVLIGVARHAQVLLVRRRESCLALLVGEEVQNVEPVVVVEEVFAVAKKGGKRSFDRTRDCDLLVERLAAAFLPENCLQARRNQRSKNRCW